MSLSNYQEHFDNSYQEIWQKTLVAKTVANMRFEAKLKYGESVERFAYDIAGVRVRTVTRGSASTIDTISDSTELLTINLEREAVFHISDGEVTQAGPLNPGEVIGGKVGHKVSQDLDYKFFSEVSNAANTFDTGDLTTLASSSVPIVLTSTTVPQMSTRMPAKLRYQEQQETSTNMLFVVDSYAGADVEEFLISKNIDLAGATFKNGFAGPMNKAGLVISENLQGDWRLTLTGAAAADEFITILGVTFTAKATPSVAGEFDIAGSTDAQGAIIENMINGAATGQDSASGYFEVSTENRNILSDANVVATYTDATDTLVVTASGRIIESHDITNSSTDLNFIHAYYGKKGAIDMVVQDLSPVDMRDTDDRRGTNVFSSYLAGIKTFTDGSKRFLDVWIDAA